MIIVSKYIADDGTEFGSKDACEMYEHSLKIKNCSLKFYDKEMILLSQENIENCIDESYYISIPDSDSMELLKELANYYGCRIPYYCGNWFYDSGINDWVCFDEDYINKFKEMISLFGGE